MESDFQHRVLHSYIQQDLYKRLQSTLRPDFGALYLGGQQHKGGCIPHLAQALLRSEAEAAVGGPYHLTGGDRGRKAERGFNGTPFPSPGLRKAVLIPEGREMTLVKDIARDPKNCACKR